MSSGAELGIFDERRRVTADAALARLPALQLLDELAADLDVASTEELVEVGRTIDAIEAACDRACILDLKQLMELVT